MRKITKAQSNKELIVFAFLFCWLAIAFFAVL